MPIEELVYDWNRVEPTSQSPGRHIGFDDETLRDGLQSPSVCDPPIEKKLELLHLMDALGIDTADIGLPGAGGTHAAGVERLAREIVDQKLRIRPTAPRARTRPTFALSSKSRSARASQSKPAPLSAHLPSAFTPKTGRSINS